MFLSCHVRISEWIHSLYWPVWLNGWVFVYELSAYELESSFSHIRASIVDTSFKYFMVIWDSVAVVDSYDQYVAWCLWKPLVSQFY